MIKLSSYDKELIWWMFAGICTVFSSLLLTTRSWLISSFVFFIYAFIVLIVFIAKYPTGNHDPQTTTLEELLFTDTPEHIHCVRIYSHGLSWWKWYFPFEEIHSLEEDKMFNTIHHTLHHHLKMTHKKFHRYVIHTTHKDWPSKLIHVYDNEDFLQALAKARPELVVK